MAVAALEINRRQPLADGRDFWFRWALYRKRSLIPILRGLMVIC